MRVARFTHVSEQQYAEAMAGRRDPLPLEEIPLPCRATKGSAGYDLRPRWRRRFPRAGTV